MFKRKKKLKIGVGKRGDFVMSMISPVRHLQYIQSYGVLTYRSNQIPARQSTPRSFGRIQMKAPQNDSRVKFGDDDDTAEASPWFAMMCDFPSTRRLSPLTFSMSCMYSSPRERIYY
jgi:hypothetical protein